MGHNGLWTKLAGFWSSFSTGAIKNILPPDHPKIRSDGQGQLLLNFGDYGEEVEVAAISGNGRRILTVRDVGVAHVWDADSGNLLAEIRPTSPLAGTEGTAPVGGHFVVFIESAALNSDGSYALLGLNDGTAVIYEVNGPTLRSVLHPPDQSPSARWGVIRAVSYSTGDLALVGFSRRRVGVWSINGTKQIAFLDPNSERLVGSPFVRDTLICSVDMSADGRHVFAGAVDMTAVVFDLKSGEVVFEAMEHAEDIITLVDGPYGVGWATTGGSVWLRRASGVIEKCLDTGEHWAEVAFDLGSERLLARGFDGSVSHWSFSGEKRLLNAARESGRGWWADDAKTLKFHGKRMFYPEHERRIVVCDGDKRTTMDRDARIVRVEFAPKSDAVAIDGWTEEVELWDTTSRQVIRSFPCAGGSGCFAFSPDGGLIAIGEIGHGGGLYPRHVYVYETATGRLLHKLCGHKWQVKEIAFSPDGRQLASLGDDLILWDLEKNRKPLLRKPLDRTTGGIAYAGSELVAVERGRVRVYSGTRERIAFDAPIEFQTPWLISGDGRGLFVARSQLMLQFDLNTGRFKDHIVALIPRPKQLPSKDFAAEHGIRAGAMHWRTEFGSYLHQSDGPRGWITPLKLSLDQVALPCASGAAVVSIAEGPTKLLGFVPFKGKLRAGRIVDRQSLMVNEQGQLFRNSF